MKVIRGLGGRGVPSEVSPGPDKEKGIGRKERGKGGSGNLTRKKEQELEDSRE